MDERAAPYIGVVGPGDASDHLLALARTVGAALAGAGAVVITGGLDGVMAAACQGAYQAGGITVGLLPGSDRSAGNPHLTVALPTGLGELRNGLLVRSSDALIAVGCSWGTLSEIALALRTETPVVALDAWELPAPGAITASDPQEAVRFALERA